MKNIKIEELIDRICAHCGDLKRCDMDAVCMYFRHDFGLLGPIEREKLRTAAKIWMESWRRAAGQA